MASASDFRLADPFPPRLINARRYGNAARWVNHSRSLANVRVGYVPDARPLAPGCLALIDGLEFDFEASTDHFNGHIARVGRWMEEQRRWEVRLVGKVQLSDEPDDHYPGTSGKRQGMSIRAEKLTRLLLAVPGSTVQYRLASKWRPLLLPSAAVASAACCGC